MARIRHLLLGLFLASGLSAYNSVLSTTVDLKANNFAQFRESGMAAFNMSPEIALVINYLKDMYDIDLAVETGTFMGNTTAFLAHTFDTVHTVEIVETSYEKSKALLDKFSNVHCHLGSSEEILAKILPGLVGRRALFYLDAHWEEHWPLVEEIEEIAKTHRNNCIIVIDDFKVPGRNDIPFDAYGRHECSHAYVKKALDQVYSDYTYHYLIPKNINSRAKFVAIPVNWAN